MVANNSGINPKSLPYRRQDFKDTTTLKGMDREAIIAFSFHNLERYFKCKLYDKSHECAVCGKEIETFDDVSLDHIVPRAKGGRTRLVNVQLAHMRCNSKKGSAMPETFHPKAFTPVKSRRGSSFSHFRDERDIDDVKHRAWNDNDHCCLCKEFITLKELYTKEVDLFKKRSIAHRWCISRSTAQPSYFAYGK